MEEMTLEELTADHLRLFEENHRLKMEISRIRESLLHEASCGEKAWKEIHALRAEIDRLRTGRMGVSVFEYEKLAEEKAELLEACTAFLVEYDSVLNTSNEYRGTPLARVVKQMRNAIAKAEGK